MKRSVLFIIALISVCSIQYSFGTTTIDFPSNINYSVATRADMAELITVPLGSDTRLDSFQFYDMIGAGSEVEFNALVYEFDPVKMMTIGAPLYDSGLRYATTDWRKTYTFPTGGISLTPGGHYVLDLHQQVYGNSGNLDIGVSGDTYSGGKFVYNWYDHWYSSSNIQTLAFQSVFNPVPEPSTLILLGMGALGLLVYAWRRDRKKIP